MDIIHLLVVLTGILSPFLFLGIFFYSGHAERRAIKRDERKYGREGLKAMLDVPAGECPFCSEDVHLGLERMDGQYFHVIKRACPNGCLTVYPIAVGMQIPGPSVEEARGNAVELWNQAVRTVSNPAACGRCGARPSGGCAPATTGCAARNAATAGRMASATLPPPRVYGMAARRRRDARNASRTG